MSAVFRIPPEIAVFAEKLADAAKTETLPRFRAGERVTDKTALNDGVMIFDPVTDADREAERLMRRMIAAEYADHGVIGEEFGAENIDAPFRWVLDPVDGTRAFICGAPTWTTLIGLEHACTPCLGVIDQPFTGERWIAHGGQCFHRLGSSEKRCRVRDSRTLSAASISTTDPRAGSYFTTDEANAFESIANASRVARFSYDAYAYGLLALGELDLVVESCLKHHDWCAIQPIVEMAGGIITGWRGEPLAESPRGRIIAAGTKELHQEALSFLSAVEQR